MLFKQLIGCALMCAATISMAQQRIEHVGPPATHEVTTSSVEMNTDIMTAARNIFPASWNGFAQKGLDVRRPSRLTMRAGESWVMVFDRWLAQEGLTARIDWSARNFYLRNPAGSSAMGLDAGAVRTWTVLANDIRLETTLERWARESGHKLVWDADRHILISAGDQFNGTLAEAINRLLSSPAIRDSDYPLEAVFYSNQPPVIRITRLGDQAKD